MRILRAKLTPKQKQDRTGQVKWYAIGYVPWRDDGGQLIRRRVQHRLEGNTHAERQAEADGLAERYERKAEDRPITFARAYTNYLETGHPVPLFGERLIQLLGLRQCLSIDDTVMVEVAKIMFGAGASPAYINRHLYTPVAAILHMAMGNRAPRLRRPKGHRIAKPIEIPDAAWFKTVAPHMGPDTLALVAFLTTHGRRLGDALGRRPADFDPIANTLAIGKTKTGEPLLIDLHPGVAEMFKAMPSWQERAWLFRDGPTSGSNVRLDIRRACEAAGVRYYHPHALGRHAFATRMLREGYSMQYVKDAGGWASIEMVSRRYGHLEQSEITAGVHKVGSHVMQSLTKRD